MYDHVSQRVNHLRFVNHWSQKEVALRLGMTPTSLSNKINGTSRWTLEEEAGLADTFQVSLEYMIGRLPLDSAIPATANKPALEAGLAGSVGRAGLEPATDGL